MAMVRKAHPHRVGDGNDLEKTLLDQPVVALADHAGRNAQLLGNLCKGNPPILPESIDDLQVDIVQTTWSPLPICSSICPFYNYFALKSTIYMTIMHKLM